MASARGNLLVGTVSDLADPDRLGRVRVQFPELGNVVSDWAPLVTLGAGSRRGTVFRPEPGDEVLVGFLQGDMRAPYVLGGVWNKPEPPPDDANQAENNLRSITSRSGHVLRFDDTRGSERIEIVDSGGQRRVVLDKHKITVSADTGDVEVSAPAGSVTLSAKDITLHATGSLSLAGDTGVKITGLTVDIN
jgi:uncharacterized protein involved in type VI secretion and phage assembly